MQGYLYIVTSSGARSLACTAVLLPSVSFGCLMMSIFKGNYSKKEKKYAIIYAGAKCYARSSRNPYGHVIKKYLTISDNVFVLTGLELNQRQVM